MGDLSLEEGAHYGRWRRCWVPALTPRSHEEIDMRRPEGCHGVGQLELVDRADEVTEGLGVGLYGKLGLALYCAGCEIEGDRLFESFHVQPPLIRWSHITPSCRG